jgi:hypothetical protein
VVRGPSLCGVVLLLALLVIAGCNDSPAPQAKPKVPAGTGVIRGTVSFRGERPAERMIPNSACHGGASLVPDETVVVDEGGGLRNVLVYLKDGPNADVPPPASPPVLDQVNCRYVPRVVAVRVGETLRVRSSDPTMHNVHGLADRNPAFNFGMTAAGETRDVTFAAPEIIRVKCDVHPWMVAHVGVFDHPFHAVSGEGGSFELTRVPPGTYTLVAWHEKYGTAEQQVTVTQGAAPAAAAFTFPSTPPG